MAGHVARSSRISRDCRWFHNCITCSNNLTNYSEWNFGCYSYLKDRMEINILITSVSSVASASLDNIFLAAVILLILPLTTIRCSLLLTCMICRTTERNHSRDKKWGQDWSFINCKKNYKFVTTVSKNVDLLASDYCTQQAFERFNFDNRINRFKQ